MLFFVGCTGNTLVPGVDVHGGDTAFDQTDATAPEIVFVPFSESVPGGTDVEVTAVITDDEGGTGVLLARLYFRSETASSKDWKRIGFLGPGSGDEWTATISGDEQRSAGMWYYLLAIDGSLNEAVDPPHGAEQPYHFKYAD
ncbi:MAG: hypothetical protein EXR71_01380 [Myxococcales bacterium]|nr:hypothetical protein [Myxococcales bacterium]